MPTRGQLFANGYSAKKRSADRWAYITKTIEQEQDRQAALQSLITAERSTLANLEQVYKTATASPDLASEILKQAFAGDIQAAKIGAAAARIPKEGPVGPPSSYKKFVSDYEKSGGVVDASEAVKLLPKIGELVKSKSMSQAEVDAIVADLNKRGFTDAASGVAKAASAITGRPARPVAPKLSAEEQQKQAGVKAALESVAMASPLGYAGGFDGEAFANQLTSEPVKEEGVSFSTRKEALDRYVQMLEDGIATPEELARVTGTVDAAQAAKEFEFARRAYNDAKAAGAFQNKDRKFFEPAWLDQAKRVTELQGELATAKQAYAGRTPSQEAAYRELRARGLNPDDPYIEYTGTKTYDYLTKADEIYGSVGDKVEPATPAQQRIVALLDQYNSMKQPWKVADLERQLGKTLKGAELTNAIGFALAYDRSAKPKAKEPTQADLQKENQRKQAVAAKALDEKQKAIREAEAAKQAAEVEIVRKVNEVAPADVQAAREEYKRVRGLVSPQKPGETAEQAKQRQEQERLFAYRSAKSMLVPQQPVVSPTEGYLKSSAAMGKYMDFPLEPAAGGEFVPTPEALAYEQPKKTITLEEMSFKRPTPAKKPATKPTTPKPSTPTTAVKPVVVEKTNEQEAVEIEDMILDKKIKPGSKQYQAAQARILTLRGK